MGKTTIVISSIILLLALNTACSDNLSEAERVARAEQYLLNGELSAAAIELKSTLQTAPDNASARLLLGRVYLETGDLFAARKELSEALSLGANPNEVVPSLSRVLASLGEQDALDELPMEGLSNPAKAQLLASRGLAALGKGNPAPAAMLIEEAAALDPGSLPVVLAQARLAMSTETNAKAREIIATALARDPGSAQAFDLLADIEWREGNLENAAAAYGQAIANQPDNNALFVLKRALLYTEYGLFDEVDKDVPRLKEFAQNSPGASYVLGAIEHHKGNYKEALVFLETARWDEANFPQSIFFTASSHLVLGNLQQADLYATRFFNVAPDNVAGRKLLAIIRQGQANYGEMIDLLAPVVEVYDDDATALDLLAFAHLRRGENDKAVALYDTLSTLQPESETAWFSLGNALLAAGDLDRAIAASSKAVELNPALERAQDLLIFTYLAAEKDDDAVRVAENYRNANPGIAGSHILLGRTLLATKQEEAASESFEKACEIDRGNPYACGKLAEMAMDRQELDQAENYYEKVLENNADHLGALVGLASLNVLQDDATSMRNNLEQAIEAHPEAVKPRLVLARFYLLKGQPEKVAPLLAPLDEASKNAPEVLRVLASAQILQKQYKSARLTLQDLVRQEPDRADSYVSLARVHAEFRDSKNTKEALQAALELEPQHFTARLALARLLLREGDNAGVESNLAVLRENAPDNPDVVQLDSDLATVLGEHQRSLALAQRALELSDTYPRMMSVAKRKRTVGDNEGAFKLLESWTQQHPASVEAQITLTMAYVKMGKTEEAIQGYKNILELDDKNVLALNDLAWHLRSRDKEQALRYAKRALEIKPESVEVLDTLALVYLENGMLSDASATIDNALANAPGEPDLLYHQALIMVAAGDEVGAFRVLDRLVKRNLVFSEKEAALALREELDARI